MGLLDDAIREHLELRRRHGVSDEEISQQEAEALGPARRQPVEPELDGGATPTPLEEELPPPVEEPQTPLEEPQAPVEEPQAPMEPVAEAPPAEPPPAEEELPPLEEEPPVEDLPPIEDEPVAERGTEGDDEDLLEETPDFLQDSPEHDQLWFEQKPPRDFDLD